MSDHWECYIFTEALLPQKPIVSEEGFVVIFPVRFPYPDKQEVGVFRCFWKTAQPLSQNSEKISILIWMYKDFYTAQSPKNYIYIILISFNSVWWRLSCTGSSVAMRF